MKLKAKRRAVRLLLDLFERKAQVTKLKLRPSKAGFHRPQERKGTSLPRSTPEAEGISSQVLHSFLKEALSHPTINPHTILVLRHKKVISHCSFSPYRGDIWHETHSMCKGITGLAVGMLIDSGKLSLEEKLCDIFPGRLSPLLNPLSYRRFKNITIRHLLTMSSGAAFNEMGAVTSEDWLKDFFESGVSFEPGTQFAYNSMNSYVLSAVVREKTGQSLTEFLYPRLFLPLGMGKVYWETCPKGIEKGGWGLYLCPEDMAKIGLLLLQKGRWNHRQLISEAFLKEMTAKQMETPPQMGEEGYGFHMWMARRPGSYLFNGLLGQNVMVLPDLDMVIVTTGGNDSLFKTSPIIALIEKYFCGKGFSPPESLPKNRRALLCLRAFEASARSREGTALSPRRSLLPGRKLPVECALLNGKSYEFIPDGTRLLPLFIQLLQNNYSDGIRKVSFSAENGEFYLTLWEGEEENRLLLSFSGRPRYSVIHSGGESFLTAASACFCRDEDGHPVLKVAIPFLEHSSSRKMKLFFLEGGKAELSLSEAPDPEELIRDMGLTKNKGARFLTAAAMRGSGELLEYTLHRAANPRAGGRVAK